MSARRPVATFALDPMPHSVAFHPNDRTLLLTYEKHFDVRLAATGEKVWGARFEGGLRGAVFAEEGRSVVAATFPQTGVRRPVGVPHADRDLVRLSEDEAVRTLDLAVSAVLGRSPEGAFALLHYGDGELGVFDLLGLTPRPPFVMAERTVPWELHGGALSRGGEIAVTSTRRSLAGPPTVSTIEVWQTLSSTRGRSGNAGGEGPVAVSPNGRFVLYGSGGNAVLWDVDKGRVDTPSAVPLANDVVCVDVETNGRRYLYGGGVQIEVVSRLPGVGGASLLHAPLVGGGFVRCARFSHDGLRVATGAADGRVFVWDVS